MVFASRSRATTYRRSRECSLGISSSSHSSRAASTVFRDMMNLAAGQEDVKPIELDDDEIETAEVLESVLDLVIADKNFGEVPERAARQVIRFLRKYDFARTLDICVLQLVKNLHEGKSPFSVFVRAAYLGEHALCGRAIVKGGRWTWTGGGEPEKEVFGREWKQATVFDLRGISLGRLEAIPVDCIWALLRASTKLGAYEIEKKMDLKAMSEEYVRLMKLQRESIMRSSVSTEGRGDSRLSHQLRKLLEALVIPLRRTESATRVMYHALRPLMHAFRLTLTEMCRLLRIGS